MWLWGERGEGGLCGSGGKGEKGGYVALGGKGRRGVMWLWGEGLCGSGEKGVYVRRGLCGLCSLYLCSDSCCGIGNAVLQLQRTHQATTSACWVWTQGGLAGCVGQPGSRLKAG